MPIQIAIDRADQAGRNYLTWAPVRATLTRTGPGGAQPVTVRISNRNPSVGGQLVFGRDRAKPLTPTLDVPLTPGAPVEFWVAGSRASVNDRDAVVSVAEPGKPEEGSAAVMVRVRKDANTLTPAERDRFTTTFAIVNDRVKGVFHNFRDMHRDRIALDQAHDYSGFLSWHRAYLLDLERELQKVDSSVALPYWRFDRPAPNVFHEKFMGRSTGLGFGNVVFDPSNLLVNWQTDNQVGVTRMPDFDTDTQPASGVLDQVTTLAQGGGRFDNGGGKGQKIALGGFRRMELNPHGQAHNSCGGGGFLSGLGSAPRDPMFFLLHCNVDRLWALWQRMFDRFDGNQANTYYFRGDVNSDPHTAVGHNLRDTMWPWNGVVGGPRPPNAPRPAFAPVRTAPWPPAKPAAGDMIDYQGLRTPGSDTNFAYDDVAYGVAS